MKCQGTTAKGHPCRRIADESGYCHGHSGAENIGRRHGLTDEVAKKITDAVRAGAFLKEAAEHAGVAERTVYGWISRAEKDEGVFAQFAQALTRASADAHVGAVATIRRAMTDDWRAAAFFLERRDPARWGKRTTTEVSGPGGGPVQHSNEFDREVAELMEQLRRADPPNGNGNGHRALAES